MNEITLIQKQITLIDENLKLQDDIFLRDLKIKKLESEIEELKTLILHLDSKQKPRESNPYHSNDTQMPYKVINIYT